MELLIQFEQAQHHAQTKLYHARLNTFKGEISNIYNHRESARNLTTEGNKRDNTRRASLHICKSKLKPENPDPVIILMSEGLAERRAS